MARLLSQARDNLQYGGWSQLWRSGLWRSGQVPFSKRKGEMLVVIGSALGNLPAQTSAQLPSAWNTIYWVALLGGPVAEQLIQQGRVYPGLTLQEAKALLAEFHPERARKASQSTVKQRVTRFTAYVRGAVEKWSQEERQFASAKLVCLVEEITSRPTNLRDHDLSRGIPGDGLPPQRGLGNSPSLISSSRSQLEIIHAHENRFTNPVGSRWLSVVRPRLFRAVRCKR